MTTISTTAQRAGDILRGWLDLWEGAEHGSMRALYVDDFYGFCVGMEGDAAISALVHDENDEQIERRISHLLWLITPLGARLGSGESVTVAEVIDACRLAYPEAVTGDDVARAGVAGMLILFGRYGQRKWVTEHVELFTAAVSASVNPHIVFGTSARRLGISDLRFSQLCRDDNPQRDHLDG